MRGAPKAITWTLASTLLLGTAALAGKIKANVTVQNASDWSIHQLFVSPASQAQWGPDQLGTETIETGGTFVLTDIPCESYDIRLIDEDGDACELNAVEICGASETWQIDNEDLIGCQVGTAVANTPPPVASITIDNQSLWVITELYLSPVSSGEWGPDQLGEHVIPASGGFELSGVPCASYDVKLVDEDGDICIVTGEDICGGANTWAIDSADLLACQN